MSVQAHYDSCLRAKDNRLRCTCFEIEYECSGRLSTGEVVAWTIFFVFLVMFIIRILANIYTI